MNFVIKLAAGLTFVFCIRSLCGAQALGMNNFVDRRSTISVSGQASVQVVPDVATVDFQVTQDAAVIPPAVESVRSTMKRIVGVLRADGVAQKDIQTQSYTVNPKFEWDNGKSRNAGYTVTDRIKVTIRDLNQAGQILADAVTAGANQVGGLQFNVENKAKAEADALTKAVLNAKAKATAMAEAAGMRLGNPVFLSETSSYQPPIRPFFQTARGAAPSVEPEPVSPGEETITASVNATFLMLK